jgi:SAM-dependent methyltransferase
MSVSLAELYQDPAIRETAACSTDIQFFGSVDEALARMEPLSRYANGAEVLRFIDGIEEHDYSDKRGCAAALLGCLPVAVLLNNFGEEVTAWTLANDKPWRVERLKAEIDEEGYNGGFLMAASMLAFIANDYKPPSGRDILLHNAAMEAVHGPKLAAIDLPTILRGSALPGIELSDKRLKDYSLLPLNIDFENYDDDVQGRAEPWEGKEKIEKSPDEASGELGRRYSVWLDAPVGFALTYKGVPQAFVSVVANGPHELMVEQLQRVHGKIYDPAQDYKIVGHKLPRGLMPLDWPQVLTRSAAALAAKLGMDSVGIRAGRKIPLRMYHGKLSCHLSDEQATLAYDMPAQRLGFTRDGRDDWHAPAQSLADGTLRESLADQALRRPEPVTAMPVEQWSREKYPKRDVSHSIAVIEGKFRALGENEGPLKRCIDTVQETGRVRVIDAGSGNGIGLADLVEQITSQTGARKRNVAAVGIDGLNHFRDLADSEIDRISDAHLDLRTDHLAHAVLEPSYYDVAYSYETLTHNDDPTAIIDNFLGALRPGGVFYCNTMPEQSETIQPLLDRLQAGGWDVASQRFIDSEAPESRVFFKFTKPNLQTREK